MKTRSRKDKGIRNRSKKWAFFYHLYPLWFQVLWRFSRQEWGR